MKHVQCSALEELKNISLEKILSLENIISLKWKSNPKTPI
jgi:hypothetical protein